MAAMMPMAAPVDLLDRGGSRSGVGELAEGDAGRRSGLRAACGDDAGESARSDRQGNQLGHYGSFLFLVRFLRERERIPHTFASSRREPWLDSRDAPEP